MQSLINKKNHYLISLLAITTIGLAVRLVFLKSRPPTLDEGLSLMFTKTDLRQLIKGTMADVHPPLYFLLLNLWAKFNQGLEFQRFFSTIFGTLTIFFIGIVGKNLLNPKVGILSAILVSLSPIFVFESTNLRMYSLAILESLAVVYFFLNFLKHQNFFNCAGLIVNLTLGIYTHYFFVFTALCLNLFLLVRLNKNRQIIKTWIFLQLIIAFLTVPLFIGFFLSDRPQLFPVTNSILKIPGVFAAFVFSWDAIQILKVYPFSLSNNLGLLFILTTTSFFLIFLYGAKLLKEERFSLFIFFLFYLFLPLFLITGYSFLVTPIFGIRSLIIFSIPFYFIVAFGLSKLNTSFLKMMFFLFLFLGLFGQYQGFKNSWQSTLPYLFVKNNSRPGDVFTYSDPYLFVLGRYYLKDKNHFALVPTWLSPEMSKAMGYQEENLVNLGNQGKRLWYFLLEPQYYNGELAKQKLDEIYGRYPKILSKKFEEENLQINLYNLSEN